MKHNNPRFSMLTKKCSSLAIGASLLVLSSFAASQLNAVECSSVKSGFEVSARAAAFVPSSHKIRKIYNDAWGDYQLEFGQSIYKSLSIWAGGQYTYSNGHSRSGSDTIRARTKIQLAPVSLGLKYNFFFGSCTSIYLGAGPTYTFLRIHDHWPFVHRHISKAGVGGLFKIGAKHYFTRLFFVEGFVDYLVQRFHFHNSNSGPFVQRHELFMDAVIAGGSIGLHF